jgi:hypothetical protein
MGYEWGAGGPGFDFASPSNEMADWPIRETWGQTGRAPVFSLSPPAFLIVYCVVGVASQVNYPWP